MVLTVMNSRHVSTISLTLLDQAVYGKWTVRDSVVNDVVFRAETLLYSSTKLKNEV